MNETPWLPIPIEAQAFAVRVAFAGIFACAVALVAARWLRRRSEPMRYGVLFVGILALLALPALVGVGQSVAPTFLPVNIQEEIVRVPAEMLPALFDSPAADEEPAAPPAGSLDAPFLGAAFVAVWLLGAGLGLSRLARGLRKQHGVLLGSPWRADFWTDELQAKLAEKLGLAKFPAVYLSPAAPMPMVIGIWKPVIVLPESAPSSWDRAQWEAILLHEGAHIARRDPWALLAQNIAVVLYWWCPLAHLLARRLNELREIICDDYALQGPCDQVRYAEILVDSAERLMNLKTVPVPLALLDSAQGGLEARITRVLEKERRPMTKLSLFGKVAAAGLLVVACLLATAAAAFSQAPPPAQKRVQIKIIVDGKEIDLGDAQLADLLAAAQKKAADVRTTIVKPVDYVVAGKVAFAPDGKFLAVADGAKVIVFDAHTGKVLSQTEQGKATQPLTVRVHDPRIEELVQAAEKIKPGSGADVRKALQGAAQKGVEARTDVYRFVQKAPVPMVGKVVVGGDHKIIILTVQDGKVQQLSPEDLHKILGKDHRIHIELKHKDGDPKKPVELEFKAPIPAKPAVPAKPATPGWVPRTAPAPTDLEALHRQLERVNAELQELRKRLEKK